MASAFYPTSDCNFWVLEEPQWADWTARPHATTQHREEMGSVSWRHDTFPIAICKDGLIFAELPPLAGDELAGDVVALNALQLLFVSALRETMQMDAGLYWISRHHRVRYDETTGAYGGYGGLTKTNIGLTERVGMLGDSARFQSPRWHTLTATMLARWSLLIDLSLSDERRTRLLAELALALGLFHDHNVSAALVHAWFVAESLISALWREHHPLKPGKRPPFIGTQLSEVETHLDATLYSDLDSVRELRNDIAHGVATGTDVTVEHANLAFSVVQRLITSRWGVELVVADRGVPY